MVELTELPAYGESERAEILDGDVDPAGVADLGLVWQDKIGHVVLRDHGRVVAHAGWLPIQLQIDGQPLSGVGLGGVLVHRSLRGGGLGATVVRAAMDRMRQFGRPIGLLFCHRHLVSYYGRLGWQELSDPVTVQQPAGPVAMPLATCWTPLAAKALRIDGPVTLTEPPF